MNEQQILLKRRSRFYISSSINDTEISINRVEERKRWIYIYGYFKFKKRINNETHD